MNKYSIIISFFIYLLSCQQDDNKGQIKTLEVKNQFVSHTKNHCPDFLLQRKRDNLNISILLDLSDRIELPNQRSKDSAYISSLANAFNSHIKTKKLALLYDKMEVFFEPVPSDSNIDMMSQSLKVSYVRGVSKNKWIPKTRRLYDSIPSEIYEVVKGRNGYPGSDIWRFFKDHVKDYCIEECRRNVLVILTDGYMYYDKTIMNDKSRTSYLTPQSLRKLQLNTTNWKEVIEKRNLGFIPAAHNLDDLEVLVIGITDQNNENPYALDIIKTYWGKWFDEMGIKRYKIKNADLPTNMEKVISDFIINK